MPYQYMVPILNSAPTTPRQLNKIEGVKAKKYMELAEVLLARFPSDTSGRAVNFLIDVVTNRDPGELPPLPFYTTAGTPNQIRLEQAVGLCKVAPAMVFQARIGR